MNHVTKDGLTEAPATPRRLSRLFKVLVVGGAIIASAYASTIQGSTGSAVRGDDDGGSKGW